MAQRPDTHYFGPAEISGNAIVHQGDKHVQNTYYICKATFSSQDELRRLSDDADHSRKLLRDEPDDGCTCRSRRCRGDVRHFEELNTLMLDGLTRKDHATGPLGKRHRQYIEDTEQVAYRRARHLVSTGPGNTHEHSTVQEECEHCADSSDQPLSLLHLRRHEHAPDSMLTGSASAASQFERSQRGVLLILLEKLRQALYSPAIARSIFSRTAPVATSETSITAMAESYNGELVTTTRNNIDKARNEVLGLCVFLLSCLTYRNVSSKDVSKIIAKCQEDRMLPFLTWLLGVGLARYFYSISISTSLNGLVGDFIVLEDAFQQKRRVPMSTCEHFSILKAFLEVHYQGKPGEPLVRAGHFNMTFGSRRGLAIRSSDWQTKGRIKAGSSVVMSLYIQRKDTNCALCSCAMSVTLLGEFFW